MELIKFDVSNTSYYVEVENGALLQEVTQSRKMILGGHGKVVENFLGKKCGNRGWLDLANDYLNDAWWSGRDAEQVLGGDPLQPDEEPATEDRGVGDN